MKKIRLAGKYLIFSYVILFNTIMVFMYLIQIKVFYTIFKNSIIYNLVHFINLIFSKINACFNSKRAFVIFTLFLLTVNVFLLIITVKKTDRLSVKILLWGLIITSIISFGMFVFWTILAMAFENFEWKN